MDQIAIITKRNYKRSAIKNKPRCKYVGNDLKLFQKHYEHKWTRRITNVIESYCKQKGVPATVNALENVVFSSKKTLDNIKERSKGTYEILCWHNYFIQEELKKSLSASSSTLSSPKSISSNSTTAVFDPKEDDDNLFPYSTDWVDLFDFLSDIDDNDEPPTAAAILANDSLRRPELLPAAIPFNDSLRGPHSKKEDYKNDSHLKCSLRDWQSHTRGLFSYTEVAKVTAYINDVNNTKLSPTSDSGISQDYHDRLKQGPIITYPEEIRRLYDQERFREVTKPASNSTRVALLAALNAVDTLCNGQHTSSASKSNLYRCCDHYNCPHWIKILEIIDNTNPLLVTYYIFEIGLHRTKENDNHLAYFPLIPPNII